MKYLLTKYNLSYINYGILLVLLKDIVYCQQCAM